MRERVANPMHHKKRGAIRTESEHPLNLQGPNPFFGTAKQIPSDQPFAQRNVRILKDRTDCDGELLVALRAMIQASANFLIWIFFDFPNALVIGIFTMRTD